MSYKFKVGDKLKKIGHINLTIYKIEQGNYYCYNTDMPSDSYYKLPKDFLEDGEWGKIDPIWLKQKKVV